MNILLEDLLRFPIKIRIRFNLLQACNETFAINRLKGGKRLDYKDSRGVENNNFIQRDIEN